MAGEWWEIGRDMLQTENISLVLQKYLNIMVGPSIIFYILFVIPYVYFMYWLVKQDKKKHMWGILVVTVIAIAGVLVSQTASKVAMENYKQHQVDAREQEVQLQADSLKNKK